MIRLMLIVFMMANLFYGQEIIVPIQHQFDHQGVDDNVYFKDLDSLLNKFTGDWIFDDGTHYLSITIDKIEHDLIGSGKFTVSNYEDFIMIKMIYKLNGVEKYNTYTSGHRTNGNIMLDPYTVKLYYSEPSNTACFRSKAAHLTLEFVPDGTLGPSGAPNGILTWTRTSRLSYMSPNHKCNDGSVVDNSDFIIPANLSLSRN